MRPTIETQLKVIITILIIWIFFAQLIYFDKLILAKNEYIASCEEEILHLKEDIIFYKSLMSPPP